MISGRWSVVGGQWLINWGKDAITSETCMVPWQASPNILKARNFFVTAIIPASARLTMSGWDGPVNLLTHAECTIWIVDRESVIRRLAPQYRQKIVDVCKILFILMNNV